jgi:intein/homing endonuclease
MIETTHDRAQLALAVKFELYKRDFARFALEQLRIKGASPGQVLPLDLSVKPVQTMIWAKVREQLKSQGYVRGRVLKGRQQGSSTCTQGIMYWKASTTPNFDSLLMAQDGDTTGRIFAIARHYYDHVEPSFKPMIRYSSKAELAFENPDQRSRFDNPGLRSRMDFVDASKKFPGTGQTRHGLHTSEAAKYPSETIHELAASFIPMLHDLPGTYHLDESTAYVLGDWFRQGCDEARSGKSRYFWVFSPWYYDPEYQLPLAKGEVFKPDAEERRIIRLAAKGQKKDGVPPVAITHRQLKWRQEKIREFELAGLATNGAELFNQEYPLDYECIASGERVGTARGLIPIEEVREGDVTTMGRVVQTGEKGNKLIYKLTTKRGYSVRATGEHPLPTLEGEVRLQDAIGHHVKLGRPQFANAPCVVRWDEDFGIESHLQIRKSFARFLGYFMGDGSLAVGKGNKNGASNISICCDARDTDVVKDVSDLLTSFFGRQPQVRAVGTNRGGTEVRTSSTSFLTLAKRLGIYSPAAPHRKVCVPECIWRSPEAVIREFLRGLFEADACKRKARSILLFSKYRHFLEEIQLLLLGFGIESTLTSGTKEVSPERSKDGKGHSYVCNELTLHAVATSLFGERIGFVGQRKSSSFAIAKKRQGRNAIPQRGIDEVVSVEPCGSAVTYDLELEEPHLFDAHGILVHNSAWISFDAFVFNRGKLLKMQQSAPEPKLMRMRGAPGSLPAESSQDQFGLESEYRAVWGLPEKGKFYDIGVDVSAGIEGGDWSVLEIIERFSNKQVAEIHLQADIVDLADEIFWWGACYNWAQVAIEFNAEGISVNQFLQRKNYPYLYFWRNRGGAFPKVTKITGWKTQRDSKRLMVTMTQAKFNRDEVVINSRWLLHDLSNFVRWPSGEDWSYGASQGHDDRPMSWMISLIASDDETVGLTEETNIALRPKNTDAFDISFMEPLDKTDEKRIQRLYQRSLGHAKESDW